MHDINSYSINIFISGISKKIMFFILYTFNNNINQTRCCTNFSIPISILKYLKILYEKFTKISSKISYQKKKKNVRHELLSFTTSDKSIHKTKNKKIKQTCFWEALQFFKLLQKILKNIRLEFSQFLPKFQNSSQSLTTISRINYLKKFLELETRETSNSRNSRNSPRRDVSANN